MLREAMGTPMRRIDLANSWLALAEPEPLTLANLTTKSFVALSGGRIDALLRASTSAAPCKVVFAVSKRNFCMSQAPVGQRSAHMPQCRHTSSSFTMTRPVFSPSCT